MLLFTLLTTLLLGSSGTLPKDTLPVVKPRPSIGLFYMTGPRGYGTDGNIGVQFKAPISREGDIFLSVGLGGFLSYKEQGIKIIDSVYEYPVARYPATYINTYSLVSVIEVSRIWKLAGGFSLSTSLQIGGARILQELVTKSLPITLFKDAWESDSTPTYGYEYYFSSQKQHHGWLGLGLGVDYKISSRYALEAKVVLGPTLRVEKRDVLVEHFRSTTYQEWINGSFDPYSTRNNFQMDSRTSYYPPNKPIVNRFDMLGYSSFNLTFTYFLPILSQ